jgi:hypothetical protein
MDRSVLLMASQKRQKDIEAVRHYNRHELKRNVERCWIIFIPKRDVQFDIRFCERTAISFGGSLSRA